MIMPELVCWILVTATQPILILGCGDRHLASASRKPSPDYRRLTGAVIPTVCDCVLPLSADTREIAAFASDQRGFIATLYPPSKTQRALYFDSEHANGD